MCMMGASVRIEENAKIGGSGVHLLFSSMSHRFYPQKYIFAKLFDESWKKHVWTKYIVMCPVV